MHVASQDATAPLYHCVPEIDDSTSRLGLDVSPVCVDIFGSGGEYLQPAEYVEKHRHGADIRVTDEVGPMAPDSLGGVLEKAE